MGLSMVLACVAHGFAYCLCLLIHCFVYGLGLACHSSVYDLRLFFIALSMIRACFQIAFHCLSMVTAWLSLFCLRFELVFMVLSIVLALYPVG